MGAEDKTLSLDSYDNENNTSQDNSVIESLLNDFPKSVEEMGDISQSSIREINALLYDTKHEASTDCYMDSLQQFVDNLWFYDIKIANNIFEVCLSDVESLLKRIRKIIDSNNGVHDDDNPIDTALYLQNRLVAIIDRVKQVQFVGKGIHRIEGYTEASNTKLSNRVKKISEEITSFQQDVAEMKKSLSEANKDMVAVMGIFTSIIVVIMSLVITSSSWLNNASGASAVIAFIIPSCVAILAVCAITMFLNIIIKDKKQNYIPWGIVFGATLIIGIVTLLAFGKMEVLPHNRLVFEVDKYATVDPDDTTGEKVINIHFTEKITTLDGEHEIEVIIDNQKESDCVIHNNLIYYCITHNRFE